MPSAKKIEFLSAPRVCIYFECAGGGGNTSCTTGIAAEADPHLQNGCCSASREYYEGV